jgi:predicted ABC-type transport system involved in lysophospholipase L1 biosynthesis ATPase subunit
LSRRDRVRLQEQARGVMVQCGADGRQVGIMNTDNPDLRFEKSATLIALRGVSRIHDGGAIAALRNVDLEIEASDCVAIVGASGSGKSSLVNLLCGIDYPSTGTVLWNGQPVRRQAEWARLRRTSIGIVFQEFNLIPTLTALENVELALFGRGMSSRRRLGRASILLDRVGLEPRMHSLITTLSGGERQRVAIARAIANEPTLLLADEPTGSLDSANAALVAELLFKLREHPKMTIVLVTHNEALAARCPRLVRIKDGSIVEDVDNTIVAPSIAGEPVS